MLSGSHEQDVHIRLAVTGARVYLMFNAIMTYYIEMTGEGVDKFCARRTLNANASMV